MHGMEPGMLSVVKPTAKVTREGVMRVQDEGTLAATINAVP